MGLAALVLVAGAPAPAAGSGPTTTDPAERKSEVDQERNRLAEHYDETLAEEAHLVAAYEQSRASATELGRQLAVLDDYVTAVQRDLDKATTAAETAASRRDALREDLRGATRGAQPPPCRPPRHRRLGLRLVRGAGDGPQRLRPRPWWPTRSSCRASTPDT